MACGHHPRCSGHQRRISQQTRAYLVHRLIRPGHRIPHGFETNFRESQMSFVLRPFSPTCWLRTSSNHSRGRVRAGHGRLDQAGSAKLWPTESSAVKGPEPSANAETAKSAKPAGQPAKPRPVVRDSLRGEPAVPRPVVGGKGDHSATRAAAVGAGAATGARSSTALSPAGFVVDRQLLTRRVWRRRPRFLMVLASLQARCRSWTGRASRTFSCMRRWRLAREWQAVIGDNP
jgi:hypothetical protein